MAEIDTELVQKLTDILESASLTELTIEQGDICISLKKESGAVMAVAAPAPAAVAAAPVAVTAGVETKAAAPPSGAGVVKSPMVGTAFMSPEPGSKAFVALGDSVKKGQTILLVEAMKTFNAVEAPKAGVVKAIYVSDSQPVEFGEPLFMVE